MKRWITQNLTRKNAEVVEMLLLLKNRVNKIQRYSALISAYLRDIIWK